MATKLVDIYSRAIYRFADYDMLKQEFVQQMDSLGSYLHMAEADFKKACPFDLSKKDDAGESYLVDLDDESIEILALGVAYYWVGQKVLDEDNFKNSLSTKEYSYFSPANLLREAGVVFEYLGKTFEHKIIDYTYYNGSISSIKI
jgi:hypothetical protein